MNALVIKSGTGLFPGNALGRALIKSGLEQDAIDVRLSPDSGAEADIRGLADCFFGPAAIPAL